MMTRALPPTAPHRAALCGEGRQHTAGRQRRVRMTSRPRGALCRATCTLRNALALPSGPTVRLVGPVGLLFKGAAPCQAAAQRQQRSLGGLLSGSRRRGILACACQPAQRRWASLGRAARIRGRRRAGRQHAWRAERLRGDRLLIARVRSHWRGGWRCGPVQHRARRTLAGARAASRRVADVGIRVRGLLSDAAERRAGVLTGHAVGGQAIGARAVGVHAAVEHCRDGRARRRWGSVRGIAVSSLPWRARAARLGTWRARGGDVVAWGACGVRRTASPCAWCSRC